MLPFAARVALLTALISLVAIVFERAHDPVRLQIAADTIEHGLIAFGLVTLASVAFPLMHLLLVGFVVLSLGIGLELLQFGQVVPGGFEVRDITANLTGAVLGLLAVGIGETRSTQACGDYRREPTEPKPPDQ